MEFDKEVLNELNKIMGTKQGKELQEKLKERYGKDLQTEIMVVNPTIGGHCGPDTVGVCFHAIHR